MSRLPLDSEPGELLRRLGDEPLPSSEADGSPERRDRLVRGMRDSIDGTFEQTQRRMRWRRGLLGVAAAAGFALLGSAALRERVQVAAPAPQTIAGIERLSGTVVLTQAGAPHVVSAGERAVHDGDSLQTAAGAHARVATSKAAVNLSESTEIRLSRPSAAEERISLRRGRVDVTVDKAVELKRSVVVETPDAEVVVRGTIFDVRVEPLRAATSTHVHVTRGSVWVLSQGVQVALLSAGQSWSSTGGVAPDASATPTAGPASEAPPVAVAPAGQSAARAAAAKAGGAHETAAQRKPGTLAEENRLFASAVEARNRGDAARAAELFGELLTTYPRSPLREVAQVEHFRALSAAGQPTRAAAAARRYLAEHGEGGARREARDLALESEK